MTARYSPVNREAQTENLQPAFLRSCLDSSHSYPEQKNAEADTIKYKEPTSKLFMYFRKETEAIWYENRVCLNVDHEKPFGTSGMDRFPLVVSKMCSSDKLGPSKQLTSLLEASSKAPHQRRSKTQTFEP